MTVTTKLCLKPIFSFFGGVKGQHNTVYLLDFTYQTPRIGSYVYANILFFFS